MSTQLTTIKNFETVDQQTATVETVKATTVKKKRTSLRVTVVKIKLFFWNLSPLHWYDDFKVMKFTMDEFMPKKFSVTNNDKSENTD